MNPMKVGFVFVGLVSIVSGVLVAAWLDGSELLRGFVGGFVVGAAIVIGVMTWVSKQGTGGGL